MSIINFPGATSIIAGPSLRDAVTAVLGEHFAHLRNASSARSVGDALIARAPADMMLVEVTTDWLRQYVKECVADENSPATINAKLSFVSVLFDHHRAILPKEGGRPLKPEVPWMPKKNVVKWWLTPEMEPKVTAWLRQNRLSNFADYVEWTTRSGLRVEESLRIQRFHFNFEQKTLMVPGTKTALAQRVIPLYSGALDVAMRRIGGMGDQSYLFDFSPSDSGFEERCAHMSSEKRETERMERNYHPLKKTWSRVRDVFGLQQNKTATLKALRRSFAKVATDNGMPTAVLQQYLGHEHIETTMEYLKVVGGYNLDVIRRWVT